MKKLIHICTIALAAVMSFASCEKFSTDLVNTLVIDGVKTEITYINATSNPECDGTTIELYSDNDLVLVIELARSLYGTTINLAKKDPYYKNNDDHYNYYIGTGYDKQVLWGGSDGTTLADKGILKAEIYMGTIYVDLKFTKDGHSYECSAAYAVSVDF